MSKSLLWGLAAVCFFISAALTYGTGRPLILAIQIIGGLLMAILALKSAKKA